MYVQLSGVQGGQVHVLTNEQVTAQPLRCAHLSTKITPTEIRLSHAAKTANTSAREAFL